MKVPARYIPRLIEMKKKRPLSDVCSKLHRLAIAEHLAYDDIHAYSAPSECYDLVTRSTDKKAKAIIEASGFINAEILRGVLILRTSEKFAHFSTVARFLGERIL